MDGKNTFFGLVGNKDFMEKIVDMQDEKEVTGAFEKEGVTPTKEEIEALKMMLSLTCKELEKRSSEELKNMKEELDNLPDSQLLAVAGGGGKGGKKQKVSTLGRLKSVVGSVADGVSRVINGVGAATDAAKGVVQVAGDVDKVWNAKEYAQIEADKAKAQSDEAIAKANADANVKMATIGAIALISTALIANADSIKKWWRG